MFSRDETHSAHKVHLQINPGKRGKQPSLLSKIKFHG